MTVTSNSLFFFFLKIKIINSKNSDFFIFYFCYRILFNPRNIFMAVFIDLWPCLCNWFELVVVSSALTNPLARLVVCSVGVVISQWPLRVRSLHARWITWINLHTFLPFFVLWLLSSLVVEWNSSYILELHSMDLCAESQYIY